MLTKVSKVFRQENAESTLESALTLSVLFNQTKSEVYDLCNVFVFDQSTGNTTDITKIMLINFPVALAEMVRNVNWIEEIKKAKDA